MKAFLKQHFMIIILSIFVLLSVLCAMTGYKISAAYYMEKNTVMKLPWSLGLTKEYDSIYYGDIPGQFEAMKGEKTILIDAEGKVIDQNDDGSILSKGLYEYREGGKYGIKNDRGQIVVKAKYNWIESMYDGYVVVQDDNEHDTIIDAKGRVVFDEKLTQSISHIDGAYYLIQMSEPFVFHAATKEKIQLPASITEIYSDGQDGYIASLFGGGQCFFLTKDFKLAQNKQLYKYVGPLSEGLRFAERYDGEFLGKVSDDFDEERSKTTAGYIDDDGSMVLKLPYSQVDYGGEFSDGKAFIRTDDSLICLDKKGKERFTLKTDYSEDAWFVNTPKFSCGYAPVTLDGKTYGFIDETGVFVVPPYFSSANKIVAGYALVKFRDSYGILNLKEGL